MARPLGRVIVERDRAVAVVGDGDGRRFPLSECPSKPPEKRALGAWVKHAEIDHTPLAQVFQNADDSAALGRPGRGFVSHLQRNKPLTRPELQDAAQRTCSMEIRDDGVVQDDG